MASTPIVFVKRRKLKTLQVVCCFCEKRHWHDHDRPPLWVWHGRHTAPCCGREYLLISTWGWMYEGAELTRWFAAVDAAVAALDPESGTFWDDCRLAFRRVQKAMYPNWDRSGWSYYTQFFEAWRARHESVLEFRKAQQQQRFEMLLQARDELLYLPRPRSDRENKQLSDVSLELGTMLALRSPSARYRGPLGEWPGAA